MSRNASLQSIAVMGMMLNGLLNLEVATINFP